MTTKPKSPTTEMWGVFVNGTPVIVAKTRFHARQLAAVAEGVVRKVIVQEKK